MFGIFLFLMTLRAIMLNICRTKYFMKGGQMLLRITIGFAMLAFVIGCDDKAESPLGNAEKNWVMENYSEGDDRKNIDAETEKKVDKGKGRVREKNQKSACDNNYDFSVDIAQLDIDETCKKNTVKMEKDPAVEEEINALRNVISILKNSSKKEAAFLYDCSDYEGNAHRKESWGNMEKGNLVQIKYRKRLVYVFEKLTGCSYRGPSIPNSIGGE